jgi:hypothetical protein
LGSAKSSAFSENVETLELDEELDEELEEELDEELDEELEEEPGDELEDELKELDEEPDDELDDELEELEDEGGGKSNRYSSGMCATSSETFLVNCTGTRTVFISTNSLSSLQKTLPPS